MSDDEKDARIAQLEQENQQLASLVEQARVAGERQAAELQHCRAAIAARQRYEARP